MWQKYNACINCGTTESLHRGKGYCNKCYGPVIQLTEVRAWDRSRPETLSRYPGNLSLDNDLDFELLREGYVKELQARLDTLKHWELSRDEPADGISIEYQLNWIARYSGAKTQNLFHGNANYLNEKLGPKERIVVRELLREIEKARPWHGVNLYRVFDYREKRRSEDASTPDD